MGVVWVRHPLALENQGWSRAVGGVGGAQKKRARRAFLNRRSAILKKVIECSRRHCISPSSPCCFQCRAETLLSLQNMSDPLQKSRGHTFRMVGLGFFEHVSVMREMLAKEKFIFLLN